MTDERGTYCHVTIAPDSPALTDRADEVTAEVAELGFTDEDAAAAQKAALAFIAEQSLDSELLDTYSTQAASDWYAANRERLVAPTSYSLYDGFLASDGIEKGLVLTADGFPPLRRDGGPRAQNIDLKVVKVYANELDGTPYIQVAVDATAEFPANNADMAAFALAHPEEAGDEAQLRSSAPFLFDAPDENGLMTVKGIFSVAFYKGDYDRFAGTTTDWTASFSAN